MSTAIVIMAAGCSRRMGQLKQLMRFEGISLLRRAVHAALASRALATVVVVGFEKDRMRQELADTSVQIVSNPNWKAGMGSTIHAAVESLQDQRGINSLILTVADSPGLTAESYNRLIVAHLASSLPIVASQYAGTAGVPVLFHRQFFPSLLALAADQGCKQLILSNAAKTMRIPCPEAALDIDTPEDFEKLSLPA